MTPAMRNFLLACLFVFSLIVVKGMQKRNSQRKHAIELHDKLPAGDLSSHSQTIELQELSTRVNETDSRINEKNPVVHKWSQVHEPFSTDYELLDRVNGLFNPYGPHLPIVQSVRYTPYVDWLKDRPAWIVDYAAHYGTSKHFISRSLSRRTDYYYDRIAEGDRFNVLNPDLSFEFALVVSLYEGKMRFYYLDPTGSGYVLLKHYKVFLGDREPLSASGSKTPLGKYLLGNRIAVYKPGSFDFFRGVKTEMVRVFGSRWIPFDAEISGCTEAAKGFGVHGIPWVEGSDEQWSEDATQMGKYQSDGCIRMLKDDIEELFSIIVTRRTSVEIVKSFDHANELYKEIEPKSVEQ